MRERPPTRGRRGHTLLETVVSTSALLLMAGGAFALLRDSGLIFGGSVRSAHDQRQLDSALDRLVRELEQASAASCTIDHAAADTDRVRFQVPVDLAGGALTFGATTAADGRTVLHPGAFIEWTTVLAAHQDGSRDLVRQVIAADGVTLLATETLCGAFDLVDAAGHKSFALDRIDRAVSLTVRRLATGTGTNGSAAHGVLRTITLRLRSQ